tara:strand:- start:34 stop:1104 length:1071 start_codon:yes stop_codon:yes gene_type:complete
LEGNEVGGNKVLVLGGNPPRAPRSDHVVRIDGQFTIDKLTICLGVEEDLDEDFDASMKMIKNNVAWVLIYLRNRSTLKSMLEPLLPYETKKQLLDSWESADEKITLTPYGVPESPEYTEYRRRMKALAESAACKDILRNAISRKPDFGFPFTWSVPKFAHHNLDWDFTKFKWLSKYASTTALDAPEPLWTKLPEGTKKVETLRLEKATTADSKFVFSSEAVTNKPTLEFTLRKPDQKTSASEYVQALREFLDNVPSKFIDAICNELVMALEVLNDGGSSRTPPPKIKCKLQVMEWLEVQYIDRSRSTDFELVAGIIDMPPNTPVGILRTYIIDTLFREVRGQVFPGLDDEATAMEE